MKKLLSVSALSMLILVSCANKPSDNSFGERYSQTPDSAIERTRTELLAAQNIESLSQQIHFDRGSTSLNTQHKRELDRMASDLRAHAETFGRLRITGFSDPLGDPITNLKLSQERANAVRDYLISRGVDSTKIEAVGMGPASAGLDGTSKSQLARDRRVQFEIVE